MRDCLPDLRGKEKEALYIIGNGFDLYHGILSKYKHFCCWLNLNGYEDFANELQKVFCTLNGESDILWYNFEDALKDYDLDYLYKYYLQKPKDNWNDAEWQKSISQARVKVASLSAQISPLMKEWSGNIRTDEIKPEKILSSLGKNSWYLTFNYTMLLEEVYNIPPTQICHIHGCINDDKKLIVGHNFTRSTSNITASSDEEERAKQEFIEVFNELVKPTQSQMERHYTFFDSLQEVSNVVVLGHSLADIDLPYFGKVITSIQSNAEWHFSVHSESDEAKVKQFVQPAKLIKKRIENYNTFNF